MRSTSDILKLLGELDGSIADDLEDSDLDFKEWNTRSMNDSIGMVVEMAVCMANGGGGAVVFGVKDQVIGRAQAVVGVPIDVDVNRLKRSVYDSTDPRLTPVFEELSVPEGTGRLFIMQIHPGMPPYTDSAGRAKIRIGKDCQPLTGSIRRRLLEESGDADFLSTVIPDEPSVLLSAAAMESLREIARRERTPEDLLNQSDVDVLEAIGVIKHGRLTRAGLLLAGKESAIHQYLPSFVWTYLRMQTDTNYSDRLEGEKPFR
jgi:ATP-dependent DNA helicase RecG